MASIILNHLENRKKTTIEWLYYHFNKKTGKPFLETEHKDAADEFAVLCEKMIVNYRLSHFEDFVNRGHIKKKLYLVENVRRKLSRAIEVLGSDAELTSDIVIKNFTLRKIEQKYKLRRGQAKIILRHALNRLADFFYQKP